MCKIRKAFYINSNDRNASSASSSNFQITLDHPLTLQDQTGLSVNSLEIPYTLKTVGPRNYKILCATGHLPGDDFHDRKRNNLRRLHINLGNIRQPT